MLRRNLYLIFVILISLIFSGCASQTPLIKASVNGDAATVKRMINEGANVNETDSRGMTPLLYALQNNNIESVEYLLKNNANVNIKDKYGYSAFYYAANNAEFTKMLIDKGADVNLGDNYKRTPLMNAISYENLGVIKLLTDNGADVNAKDYAGFTPLMFTSSPKIVELLIDRGADVNIKNNEGYTALGDAINNKATEKVALIRKKTNYKEEANSLGMYEALKTPSYYNPVANEYDVPAGKELAYRAAVYDCNHIAIIGKTGLLLVTGPVGYLVGMAYDAATVPKKFHRCMEIMGFKSKNNSSK